MFRKSTKCEPAACVEVDLDFTRSSKCDSGACVEVSMPGDMVLVRDGKNPGGPVLSFTKDEWAAFVAGVKSNEFNV